MKDRSIEFVPATDKTRAFYRSEITLNYRRIRKFLGWTKTEAREKLATWRIAAKRGDLEKILNPRKKTDEDSERFGVYARSVLDSAEWKAKRSADRNEVSLLHLNQEFKDYRLSDIKSAPVRQYVTYRIEKESAAPATTNRELSLLKSILNVAEADEIIPSNPIRGRRVKKQPEEIYQRENIILKLNLSDDDLRRLIDLAPDYMKPILKLALTTGMRLNEMLKTKWRDVDFEKRMIRIPAENAKSKKERVVPINRILCEELKDLDSFKKKNEYVFVNPETGGRRKYVQDAFFASCKAAKIPTGRKEGLVFHDLRHIAAFNLVKVTDIVTASKILGHSDVKMTMRYCHSTEKDKIEAVEKVAEKLFGDANFPVNHLEGVTKDKEALTPFVNLDMQYSSREGMASGGASGLQIQYGF